MRKNENSTMISTSASINQIPTQSWKIVFQFLDYLSLFAIKYSSSQFRKLLKELQVDKVLDLRNTKLKDENNTIYKILKRHTFLETIIIEFKAINDTHIFLLGENVVYLNLNGCQKLTDRSLVHISKKCQNLKRLEIYWIPSITDHGLAPVVSNCEGINHLNISGCKHITKESLMLIPQKLKHLRLLDMTRCTGVTDDTLNFLLSTLDNLTYLNLYALPYLNCIFLSMLKNNKLEFLDLCGNSNVNDDLFEQASNQLCNLKYLNLSWCQKVTDRAISYLSNTLVQLELLSLHGLLGITDQSIELLSQNNNIVSHLHTLDLYGCKNVKEKSPNYLVKKFPKLIKFQHFF